MLVLQFDLTGSSRLARSLYVTMLVLDACSIVDGWDNYPIRLFPKVWHALARSISFNKMTMARVALEEVGHVSPDCEKWVHDGSGLAPVEMDNNILKISISIKNLLEIKNDVYGPKGVDENGIFIIATARS